VVIGFFTGGKDSEHITDQPEDSFCYACKVAGLAKDCDRCTRDFKVIDLEKTRAKRGVR